MKNGASRNDRPATQRDVARIAGVSPRTVSNVVNETPWISAETRRVVKAAIAETGYVPNLSARGLRQGRTRTIALGVPELRNPWFTELADAVITSASERGLAVILEQLSGRAEEIGFLSGPQIARVDGAILAPVTFRSEDAPMLAAARRPIVLLGEYLSNSPVDQVTVSDHDAARTAVGHLLERGRRRLLIIGTSGRAEPGPGALRLAGIKEALASHGLTTDDAMFIAKHRWNRDEGRLAIVEAVQSGLVFDAVFALNDALALGAMLGLREAGLTVPEEVAVVGFDDIEEARYAVPPLTTMAPDVRAYGSTAVSWLVERITEHERAAPRLIRIGSDLVARSST